MLAEAVALVWDSFTALGSTTALPPRICCTSVLVESEALEAPAYSGVRVLEAVAVVVFHGATGALAERLAEVEAAVEVPPCPVFTCR